MAVNLNQYQRTVGVFNNRKIPLKKTHGPSLEKKYFDNSPDPNSDNPNCTYSKICNLA